MHFRHITQPEIRQDKYALVSTKGLKIPDDNILIPNFHQAII